LDGRPHPVTVAPTAAGCRVTGADGRGLVLESEWQLGRPLFLGAIDGRRIAVQVDPRGPGWHLTHGGSELDVLVLRPHAAELAAAMPKKTLPDHSKFLLSPMPGLLVSLAVEIGQDIKAGEQLAVVEAMKMENVLRAARDGRVSRVHATPGDSLAVDQAILEYE
jgi:propionyl-CoA carboxylase alpha chain